MLWQDHSGAQTGPVQAVTALADAVESVAGSDNPGIRRGAFQILAKILENGRRLWRLRRKVIECFINAGSKARCRNIMAEDAMIHHLCEEARLRNQLVHQVRNILLPFRRKRFLIPRASTKSNNDHFLAFWKGRRAGYRRRGHKSGSQRDASSSAQEFASLPR